jgi:hypothetical protein
MKRADSDASMIPCDGGDVIPAFSLVELHIASKNSDSAENKFSGINVMRVRRLPSDVSIHSVAGILDRLPTCLNDALLAPSTKAFASPCISSDLVKDSVAFFCGVCSSDTTCSLVTLSADKAGVSREMIRLSGWSMDKSQNMNDVDLHADSMLRLTNTKKVEHVMALLQVAFAMGSVSLLVAHDAFLSKVNGSCLHGVALINAAKMFAGVKFDPSTVPVNAKSQIFDTSCKYFDGEAGPSQAITLEVGIESVVGTTDVEIVPSPDFPMSIGYSLDKAHLVTASFAAAPPDKDAVEGVLRFFLNLEQKTASSSMCRGVVQKRKLTQMMFS